MPSTSGFYCEHRYPTLFRLIEMVREGFLRLTIQHEQVAAGPPTHDRDIALPGEHEM